MNWLADIQFALVVLRNRPMVPLLTAAVLALSVGVAGGLWAVVDAVALRPLPYPDAHQLVTVMESHPERGLLYVTAGNYSDWSTRVHALPSVTGVSGIEASLSASGHAVRVVGTKVTDTFFAVMAVHPAVGRSFSPADFHGAGRVVIISDALWGRQFDRNPEILGSTVLLDGIAYTVIGVMPRTFRTIGHSELWLPWLMTAEERAERRFHMVSVIARLQSGSTAADAERELHSIYRQLAADHPETADRWSARVIPLRELMLGDSSRALQALGAAVAALLLVASINLAGLTLAWVRSRRAELMIRLALGASTGRISRQFVAEAGIWALAGIVGGIWLAAVFVRLFAAVGVSSSVEFDFEPRVDLRVVLPMAALLATLGVTTMAIPAWILSHRAASLVTGRGTAARLWTTQLTLSAQVALSLFLLCTAATLLLGFRRALDAVAPTSADVFAVDISLAETRYGSELSRMQYFDRLLTSLASRPEISRATAASYVPPGRSYGNVRFSIDGQGEPADSQTALVSAVDAATLPILGLEVRRGRIFDDRDGPDTPRVAVISAALARRYWDTANPLGHRLVVAGDPTPATIVGVVDDARQPLAPNARTESVVYFSYRQVPWPFMTILLVPAGAPLPALAALREEAARLDPMQALSTARPLDEVRNEWMTQPRLRSYIVSLFAVAAFVLTVAGLWARVSWGVTSRAREWAIRHALGAQPRVVMLTAMREVFIVVMTGTAVGVGLLPLSRLTARAVIGGLPQAELRVVAVAVLLFVGSALASAYAPARRAGRADPAFALRAE